MNGCGMPEDVWGHPAAGALVILTRRVPTDDLVDAEAGEGLSSGREHGCSGHWGWVLRGEQRVEQIRGLVPERARAPLVAFAVQTDHRVVAQVEVLHAQVRHFWTRAPVL